MIAVDFDRDIEVLEKQIENYKSAGKEMMNAIVKNDMLTEMMKEFGFFDYNPKVDFSGLFSQNFTQSASILAKYANWEIRHLSSKSYSQSKFYPLHLLHKVYVTKMSALLAKRIDRALQNA